MALSTYHVGKLYDPKYNNIEWTQPGGAGTPVYPQQVTGGFDLLSNKPFSELSGQYIGVCGHSFNMCTVFREVDVNTGESVALLCCPSCSCVQRTISPFSDAVSNGLQNAILYP